MKAMILAAGRGKRMRPLTDHTPKPLLPIGKKPLIEYHLENLVKGGFSDVVINIAHLAKKIRDTLGNGQRYGLKIHYSDEGQQALETGGGILRALPLLGNSPFLVINGDIWCDYPLKPRTITEPDLAHLILVDNPAQHPNGDFSMRKGRLFLSGDPMLTFSGIGYYHPKLFQNCHQSQFPLAPLLQDAARQKFVSAEYYKGRWYDIGTPERLHALNESLMR